MLKRFRFIFLAIFAVFLIPTTAFAVPSFPSHRNVDKLFGGGQIRDNSIQSQDIKNGTIQLRDLNSGLIKYLTSQNKTPLTTTTITAPKGDTGATGLVGPQGNVGPAGPQGATGDAFMAGAYWSIANYDVGNTNAGAIATAACKNGDTAINGGVQTLGLDSGANSRNTPVSSSFAGRMDWSTFTPFPGRLDGWVIQFGGNAGTTSDKAPEKVKVSALCVPGMLPVIEETYTQSND